MKKLNRSIVSSFLLFSLISCQPATETVKFGTLRVIATDAPINYDTVSSAKVTVNKIVLRKNGDKITVMDKIVTLDLMHLRNGLVESLSQLEIPVGEYNEVILVITEASVEMKDGSIFPLTVPSGASSGLKVFVKPSIVVSENLSSDLLLDFDLSRSFVSNGSGFNFNPVIRATNLSQTGSISGIIYSNNNTPIDMTDDVPVAGAVVTISNEAEVVTTALSDDNGFYKVIGLSPADYNVEASGDGYNSDSATSSVVSGNESELSFALNPAN